MSKEISPLQILFPFISLLSLGSGITALNSLGSVTGEFLDPRNVFRDSRLPQETLEHSNSTNKTPTLEDFKELRRLEMQDR
jgi:hypothetical protein